MSHSDDPFALLDRFLAVPSLSGEEGPYAQVVKQELEARAYEVELQEAAPGRPNLLAKPQGLSPQVYYSTHIDVVPPHIAPRREGEKFFGRGAVDTKGPQVAMLHAAERLKGEGLEVGFLFVVGEEVDHIGAIKAAEGFDLGDDARILLGEPTSNRVVVAQKGMLKVTAHAEGIAGHSAFPERGISAIHRLLDYLAAVRAEHWPSDTTLGPTTFNVGQIRGGVAHNVFAPEAEADLLFRLVCPAEQVLVRLRALAPEGVELMATSHNDPIRLDAPEGVESCVVPFNTDASYLEKLGRVWLCGPGAIEIAHSDHEHIDRVDLEAGIDRYAQLARAAAER